MADRQLTLNQQIALLPVSIPDSILDFLEDFNHPKPLQTDSARSAFDPEYLLASGESLRASLHLMRQEMGPFRALQVDPAGREVPGGYLVKIGFEKGERGIGILTKIKERTIFRVCVQNGNYDEAGLRELLKNPPK
jgi:hypothetical protein